jgi:hypothetical protein
MADILNSSYQFKIVQCFYIYRRICLVRPPLKHLICKMESPSLIANYWGRINQILLYFSFHFHDSPYYDYIVFAVSLYMFVCPKATDYAFDDVHRRTAWGVQKDKRRPQAACTARHRRVWLGRSGWNLTESMATPCHTPMMKLSWSWITRLFSKLQLKFSLCPRSSMWFLYIFWLSWLQIVK